MVNKWSPPGKNCGACGSHTCFDFVERLGEGSAELDLCPFYSKENIMDQDNIGILENPAIRVRNTTYSGIDVAGKEYDFVLLPFPGEPSARKFIVPFRADLVELWGIKKGDLVIGRPAGPGRPLYHALRVLSANPL